MKLNKIKILGASVLVLLSVFLFAGCSTKTNTSTFDAKSAVIVSETKSKDASLYTSTEPRENLKRISRSDMTVLYFDESNYSICIYDTGAKKLWRALPEKSGNEKPAIISVTVNCKGREYILNSQDDSVAQKLVSYEIGDNNVSINYSFKKEIDGKVNIDFTVPLVFTARDGMMSIELDCEKMNESNKGNAVIEKISLLNWFGSTVDSEKGDYLFIPDGSGAIIETKPKPKKFKNVSLPVYEDGGAYIASFGMKTADSAFVALVEQGDAVSTINAEKALSSGGSNKVYASFDITQAKKSDGTISLAGKPYNDTIKISYRFLSYDTADYVGMASACRELLIRNSVLDLQEQNDPDGSLPLNLTLIGAAKFAKPGKGSHESISVLTNPEQAYDILSYIKSKGIGSINVAYQGIFKGAIEQKSTLKLAAAFKEKKKINELIQFAQNQNIEIFAGVNLFSAAKSSIREKAIGLNSKPVILTEEMLSSTLISSTAENALQRAGKLEKISETKLASVRKLDFTGVCLNDAGKILYSDNTKNKEQNQQQVKETITNQVAAFSASKKLMISGGNIYSLKYAKAITDLPNEASLKRKYVQAIPFMQILLHGYTDYSSTAFNLETDSETAFLKAVEYGCVPAYDLYFADYSTDETQDNYSYENYVSQMQVFYERMNSAFSGLRDKKITAHSEVKSGVFCTEYGSSASIYVNYNDKDVTVNGITVEAKSFIRV